MAKTLLSVNGTLMRGFTLHHHLDELGATFVKESKTKACYRLYSINDEYPAMIYDESGLASSIRVEVYEIDEEKIPLLMEKEPKGLKATKVFLTGNEVTIGILGTYSIIRGQKEITKFGGWKHYIQTLSK